MLDRREENSKLVAHVLKHSRITLAATLMAAALSLVAFVLALHANAGPVAVLALLATIAAGVGSAYNLLGLVQTMSDLQEAEKESLTDISTGVHSLSFLEQRLTDMEQHARETLRPAIVLYVDMIHLDRVNGEFGYTTGDIVLKSVAQMIVQAARNEDVVGRVVGDEFCVVMPDSTIRDAEALSAKIRAAVDGFRMDLGRRGSIDFLGCKIGTAVFPSDGPTPESIIATARARMT